MKMTGNTILITGGGSGIGRALAEAFHGRGNQVVIAGRGRAKLDETTAANPGMKSATLDIADPADIKRFAAQITADYPALNVVVNNAGIMRTEKLLASADVSDAEAIVTTNLLGPIRLTAALLPVLRRQAEATVMTVSSGLAFLPGGLWPTYCATKAAIHSYSETLRVQLAGTPVKVVELVPPYVQTELQGARQKSDPNAMPLADYIAEVMGILQAEPGAKEIVVDRAKGMRFAVRDGTYDQMFAQRNAPAGHG